MMIFKKWDIVAVPFPFSEKGGQKKRPALIISGEAFNQGNGHCILAMITSVEASWRGDYLIGDLEATGLPHKSIIRPKIFTLDNRLILKTVGHLSNKDVESFKKELEKILD